MTHPNSMLAQVHSLPGLLREEFDRCDEAARSALPAALCSSIDRVYLAGCGDSHHVGLSTELAVQALTGLPARTLTALHLGRYVAEHLPGDPAASLVVGISVSGSVARTTEAVAAAGRSGAVTLAVSTNPGGRLARAARHGLLVPAPAFDDPAPHGTPGVRSYALNQLVLYLLAVHLGELRGRLSTADAGQLRAELRGLAAAAERTIAAAEPAARKLLDACDGVREFVFLGAGPNHGTALFSAAKLLEACGDTAIGEDTEEWAHLQYYLRSPGTLTTVITAAERDLGRATEIITAARATSRLVAVVTRSAVAATMPAEHALAFADGPRELFSPVVAAIPAALLAAHRADQLQEVYFRPDRPLATSRIRTSETLPGTPP